MVNRRSDKDGETKIQAKDSTNQNLKAANRKGSKASDVSETKKDAQKGNGNNRKNVDHHDNLKKRDAPATHDRRKSSDDSEEEVDQSGSDNESISGSDDEDNHAQDHNNDSGNKRNKQTSDNVEYEVYVGDLSFDASESDIRKHFASCGQITQIKLLTRDDGKSRGRGFIKFGDEKSLKNALKLNSTDMMGRKIVVEIPANASQKRPSGPNTDGQESASVIVRNLPFNIDEDEFGNLFKDCGSIIKYRIIKNESGQSKGFGFVDFESPASAKNALSKSGLDIKGRNITVDFSIPKERSFGDNRGSFGGNRGGRGGFGGNRGFGGGRGGFGGNRGGRGGFGGNRGGRGGYRD